MSLGLFKIIKHRLHAVEKFKRLNRRQTQQTKNTIRLHYREMDHSVGLAVQDSLFKTEMSTRVDRKQKMGTSKW